MPIGSIVGGLIGQGGAQAAGAAYGQGVQNADFIRRQNEAKLSPWWQAGYSANNLMSELNGLGRYVDDGQGYGGVRLDDSNWQGDQKNAFARFQTSPDYQFRLSQGQTALDRSAASKGMLLSGAQTKASQQFGGDLASGEYNNWYNKLAGQSGQGLTAAGQTVASNSNALGQQNAALAGQASSYQNSANALANGIGNASKSLASIYGLSGGGNPFSSGGGMGAAGTPGSPYYGPVYSGF